MIYNDDNEGKKKDKNTMQKDSEETLKKTRKILLFSEINKDSANAVINSLIMLDNDNCEKPIWLYINSPGGEVDSGFAIYDMIKFVKSPVYILGTGLVASAATLIYSAVSKERRFALPHSSYLIHQPLAKMKGVAIDVEIYTKNLEGVKLLINKILADACGQDINKVQVDTDRDYYMTANEAEAYGLVGKIVSSETQI